MQRQKILVKIQRKGIFLLSFARFIVSLQAKDLKLDKN